MLCFSLVQNWDCTIVSTLGIRKLSVSRISIVLCVQGQELGHCLYTLMKLLLLNFCIELPSK
jgi:hypothetical protein